MNTPRDISKEQLLTVNEASNMFRVSPKTIYHWVSHNEIPHVRIAGSIRFVASDMVEILTRAYRPVQQTHEGLVK